MVDGALLLVDASEGIEQQTKFVTRKALALGLPIICVINKVDRPESRPGDVYCEILDYLESVEYKGEPHVLYASGREGWAKTSLDVTTDNMNALFEAVIKYIPAPKCEFTDNETRLSVRMVDSDKHLGRLLIGKVESGVIKVGQTLIAKSHDGMIESAKITKILKRKGMVYIAVDCANVGDIVSVAGFDKATVGHTLLPNNTFIPLTIPEVDPPTLSMVIEPNTSPLLGRVGKKLTSQLLQARLLKEAESDVSLRAVVSGSSITIAGRGEMHLGVLIENLRREGFEMTVYPPEVRIVNNQEPWEQLILEMDMCHMGEVISQLNLRRADIFDTVDKGIRVRIGCVVSAKNILGYRSKFLAYTQGSGLWSQSFDSYRDITTKVQTQRNGVLVSTTSGIVTSYALDKLESRGEMFIDPGIEVYEGMIIGENSKENDLDVNPVQAKKLTNVRASGKDDAIKLTPPRKMTLEDALLYMEADECLEVTPKNFRLRKRGLSQGDRKKFAKTR